MNPQLLILLLFSCISVQAELGGLLQRLRRSRSISPLKGGTEPPPKRSSSFSLPQSSTNAEVLKIKNDYRSYLDKITLSCHDENLSPNTTEAATFPYELLSDACKMAIAEVYGMPKNDELFRENVLKMLGRTVCGASSRSCETSKVTEPLAHMAAILTEAHGLDGQVILNYLNRRLFVGFSGNPINEQDFDDMREEAIRLVGDTAEVRSLAESEEMTRSLRSMAFSSCPNLEAFNNLASLLLKGVAPIMQRVNRLYNKSVWTAVFATVLKLTQEAMKDGYSAPEQQAFLFFYKKGRFAEVYENFLSRVHLRQ